jgi:TRAP-type C4-dicarboxylate transport system permease small subunit
MPSSDFKNKLDRISEALLDVSGITCLVLPVIILAVVIIRAIYAAGMPLWSIDICELLMWFVTYLGLGYVWHLGRHITVDVFIKNLPPRWRWINDTFILGILLVMTVIIMAGGFWVCWDSWMTQKKTANEFPEYFLSLAIPVGMVFLVYEVAVSLRTKLASPGSESDRTPASH